MARDMEAATLAAFTSTEVVLAFLVEIDTDGGPARFWTGFGELVWDSVTWYGAGQLGRISEVSETIHGIVTGATYELSGVGGDIAEMVLDEQIHGRSAKLWAAAFDNAGRVIQGDPVLLRHDFSDSLTCTDDADTSRLTLEALGPGADRGRTVVRVYSPADQQSEFPGDTGMDRQPTIGVNRFVLG